MVQIHPDFYQGSGIRWSRLCNSGKRRRTRKKPCLYFNSVFFRSLHKKEFETLRADWEFIKIKNVYNFEAWLMYDCKIIFPTGCWSSLQLTVEWYEKLLFAPFLPVFRVFSELIHSGFWLGRRIVNHFFINAENAETSGNFFWCKLKAFIIICFSSS